MNIEDVRRHCIDKPDVEEGFPFGETVLVFKVNGKIFLLLPLDTDDLQFNIKCDPERAVELRAEYPCVHAGFHMNKTHWNTIHVDGSVADEVLYEWIDYSYSLVSMSKKKSGRRSQRIKEKKEK